MRARVVHAVTLRLDSTMLGDGRDGLRDEVVDALDAALSRAVSASAATVLDRRAPGYGVEPVVPTPRWEVPPSVVVSDGQRERVEDAVRAAVARALATARDEDPATTGATQAAIADPGESLDRSRLMTALRRYVVPSYGGSGKQAVKVVSFTEEEAEEDTQIVVLSFVALAPEQVADACKATAQAVPGGPPAQGQAGVVYLGTDGDIWVGAVTFPELTVDTYPVRRLFRLDPRDLTKPLDQARLDAQSSYELRYEGTGDQAVTVLLRRYGGAITAQLERDTPHTDLDGLRIEEYNAGIAAEVDRRIKAGVGALAPDGQPPPTHLLSLVVDGGVYLLGADDSVNVAWVRPGLVLPLNRVSTTEVLVPRPAMVSTGTGGESGGADGAGGAGAKPGETGTDGAQGRGGGDRGGAESGTEGVQGKESGQPGGTEAGQEGGTSGGAEGGVVGQTGRRAIVRGEGRGRSGSLFPTAPPSLFTLTQSCEAFEGEPSLDELGEEGRRLRGMVAQIAADLDMKPCEYVGAFLVDTGAFLAGRARQVALATSLARGRPTSPPKGVKGNLGELHFVPSESPQIQLMRHLAGVVPAIQALSNAYRAVLAAAPGSIHGVWRNAFISWDLRFMADLNNSVAYGVGQVFADTSAVLFLELLITSAETIAKAKANLATSAPVFQGRILPMLARVDDLTTWRDRLRRTRLDLAMGHPVYTPSATLPGEQLSSRPGRNTRTCASSGGRRRQPSWRASAASPRTR